MDKLKEIKRNAKTGLLENVDYIFTDDGMVDWRKMVKLEYLVPNKEKTNETDVTKLNDGQLIILLGGIKELAQIRGYTDVNYKVTSPSSDYVVATCTISWIPNYETEGKAVTFSAVGDASPHNTNSFARNFLGPIAENRAFNRCIRSFLKINIVSVEELSDAKMGAHVPMTENSTDPKSLLKNVMKEKGVSFEIIKKKLINEECKGAESFNSIDDIPKNKIFELIERLKKVNK
jgi:hypothetical protein